MKNFFEKFHLNKGTEIYKEDLIRLEELLKDSDVSREYGVKFSDDNYFKYEVRYLTNDILSIHSFNSIKDIAPEYENIEIESLDIEKRIHEGSVLKQKIIISIKKRYLTVSIWADHIQKLKTLKLLIEDCHYFFLTLRFLFVNKIYLLQINKNSAQITAQSFLRKDTLKI